LNTNRHHIIIVLKVPMAAELWCLPIQINNQSVKGFDTSSYSTWDWQADYRDMDLAACR